MKRLIGFLLSFIEEYSFLGMIAFLIAFFYFRIPIGSMYEGLLIHNSHLTLFKGYMFVSLIVYPIAMVLSILMEKTGFLYEGQYSNNSIIYDLFFNVWNDIVFPIYALNNRKQAPVSVAIAVIIWIVVVAFVVVGFLIVSGIL